MDRSRRSTRSLDESAEDLYEHAPCGYLSTLPDGTIVKRQSDVPRMDGDARDALLGRHEIPDLLTIGSRIYYETHYAPLLQMQGFVNEIATGTTAGVMLLILGIIGMTQEYRHRTATPTFLTRPAAESRGRREADRLRPGRDPVRAGRARGQRGSSSSSTPAPAGAAPRSPTGATSRSWPASARRW